MQVLADFIDDLDIFAQRQGIVLAQDHAAKALRPFLFRAFVTPIVNLVLSLEAAERVGGGAERNHRPSRFHVVDNVLHLNIRQIAESREQDHQVGRIQSFQSRDVVALVGIDGAVLRVDREQHSALEAMLLCQDFRQLRQGFLGTILFIAAWPAKAHGYES